MTNKSRTLLPNRVNGFTVLELVVVVAVVGILLAISVPAVQRIRESARRAECANHLRQIGVALQNHQSQFRSLPKDGFNGYGYGVFLLPNLEQTPLFDSIKPLTTPLTNSSVASPGKEDAILPIFRCSSAGGSPQLAVSNFGRSNYLASSDLLRSIEFFDLLLCEASESNQAGA